MGEFILGLGSGAILTAIVGIFLNIVLFSEDKNKKEKCDEK